MTSENGVTQSYSILCDPWTIACQAPPSMGFSRQNTGMVAISFSRGSSWPRDWTQVSHIAGRFFISWATRKPLCTYTYTDILVYFFPGGGSVVKNPPAIEEIQFWPLGQEDPLEKEIGTHFSILAWEIWTEGPGRLQSMGSQESQKRLSK